MPVQVNEAEWNSLSDSDKEKISKIIGGYFHEEIVTDPSQPVPASMLSTELEFSNPFCRAACRITFETATAACLLLTEPAAVIACMGLAQAAKDICLDEC
jgi:hypothetical protein